MTSVSGTYRVQCTPTGGVEVLEDPIVHSVQVLDIERREGQRAVELLRKETLPRVIAHEHHPLACVGHEELKILTYLIQVLTYLMEVLTFLTYLV